jgi:type IV pilus assembly protein PilA
MTKNVHAVPDRFRPASALRLERVAAFRKKHREASAWHGPCLGRGVMLATFSRSSAPRGDTRAAERGFTLVELMIVVAIIGVLATLATYGVRKYILEAKKAEAASMITQIRAAEEAYRDETFTYLGLSSFALWHPVVDPDSGKRSWLPSSPNAMGSTVLYPLGVMPTGAVSFSYAVVAGGADSSLPTSIPTAKTFDFPEPTGPFYIAMAKGDLDDDGRFTYALSHSDTSEIYIEDHY